METVLSQNAPRPAGHYSQAIIHNGLIYLSGQLPINPVSGIQTPGCIESQTLTVLNNIEAVLIAAGSDRNHVLKMTAYINGIELWNRVNTVYGEFFGEHKPARTIVPTRELHHGFSIEMDAIACIIQPNEKI